MHLAGKLSRWKFKKISPDLRNTFAVWNQVVVSTGAPLRNRLLVTLLEALGALYGFYFLSRLISGLALVTSLEMGGVALVLFVSIGWLRRLAQKRYRDQFQWRFRRTLLQQLHQIALDRLANSRRDEWIGRLKTDLSLVESFFLHGFPRYMRFLSLLVVMIPFTFLQISIFSASIITGFTVVIFVGSTLLEGRLAHWNARRSRFEAEGTELFVESLEGIRTIRSFGMEPYLQRRFDTLMLENLFKDSRVETKSRYLAAFSDPMVFLAVALTLIAESAIFGNAELPLVFGLALVTFWAAKCLGEGLIEMKHCLISTSRVSDLLKARRDLSTSITGLENVEMGKVGALIMKDIIFESADGLLGPLTIRQVRGQLNVLTGPSGSGKSSVIEVLAGLRNAVSGHFKLEDTSGRPIWSMGSLRPRVPMAISAYVEQYPYLFKGTLRENLLFGNNQRLSDAVIWETLEKVALHEVVKHLGGLDFEITDRGAMLSKGERYRVAVCRALLLRRPFLILDEPFRHLDDTAMSLIVDTLRRQRAATGILIATRFIPKALKVDVILSLEEGKYFNAAMQSAGPPAI